MPVRTSTAQPGASPLRSSGSAFLVDEDALTRAAPQAANLGELGGYVLASRVSRGGIATRFHVHRPDRPAARFAMTVAACGSAMRAPVIAAFAEAHCTGSTLDHPSLSSVVDGGIDAGYAFLVTTLPDAGTTLRALLARDGDPLALERVGHIVASTADALDWLHARNHFHRLLAPEAVLLGAAGDVMVADAALGSALGRDPALETLRDEVLSYHAPEDLDAPGSPVTAARDVFALASIAFEALTGQVAFPDGSRGVIAASMHAALRPDVRSLRPDVPRAVGAVLARAWAVWPLARHASARSFAEDLVRALRSEPSASMSGARPKVSLEPAKPPAPRIEIPAPKLRPMRRAAVTHVGRYAVVREIASGGMARVYLAREAERATDGSTRVVAIKRCHDHLMRNPEFATMFRDEARIVARLRHPNVVATLEVAEDEALWLAMEYVEGDNLGALRRMAHERGTEMSVAVTVRVMIDALRGLHAAHELRDADGTALNVIHRDVSPQNILVGIDGVARVADFGIACAEGRRTVTQDGEVKGKLGYVAPEQIRGDAYSRRVDVYSAGVVLWETLTGERLFHGPSDGATIAQVLRSQPRRPSDVLPSVPTGLDALVLRALERDPSRRFATASEFANALECCAGRIATAREVGALVDTLVGERVRAWRAAADLADFARPSSLPGAIRPTVGPPRRP